MNFKTNNQQHSMGSFWLIYEWLACTIKINFIWEYQTNKFQKICVNIASNHKFHCNVNFTWHYHSLNNLMFVCRQNLIMKIWHVMVMWCNFLDLYCHSKFPGNLFFISRCSREKPWDWNRRLSEHLDLFLWSCL